MRKCRLATCVMFGALLVPCAVRALQFDSGLSASDAKEVYNYSLTMDKIQKMATATSALQELGKGHPEMEKNMQQSHSIDRLVQNIQDYPEAVAAIKRGGLTPREYVVCLMTVMQTSMAVGLKKSGSFKDYPPQLLQQVSRSNLDFTEQHWEDIRKLVPGGSDSQ